MFISFESHLCKLSGLVTLYFKPLEKGTEQKVTRVNTSPLRVLRCSIRSSVCFVLVNHQDPVECGQIKPLSILAHALVVSPCCGYKCIGTSISSCLFRPRAYGTFDTRKGQRRKNNCETFGIIKHVKMTVKPSG